MIAYLLNQVARKCVSAEKGVMEAAVRMGPPMLAYLHNHPSQRFCIGPGLLAKTLMTDDVAVVGWVLDHAPHQPILPAGAAAGTPTVWELSQQLHDRLNVYCAEVLGIFRSKGARLSLFSRLPWELCEKIAAASYELKPGTYSLL